MRFFNLLITLGIFAATAVAYSNEVSHGDLRMNGDFDDWTSIPQMGTDPAETNPTFSASNFIASSVAHDGANVFFFETFDAWATLSSSNNIMIDTDGDSSTGFKIGGAMSIGAEVMVQGATIFRFAGTSQTNWAWTSVGTAKAGLSGSMSERAIPRRHLAPVVPQELRIVFWGDQAAGHYDFFPDTANTDGGEFFTYELPDYTPTCNDRIRNGNEEGKDCGGECPECMLLSQEITEPLIIDGDRAEWHAQGIRAWSLTDRTGDSDSLDLYKGWAAHDDSHVYFLDEYAGELEECGCEWATASSVLDFHNNIFIDIDDEETGFAIVPDFGADYLVQGHFLWKFSGCANDHWAWQLVGSIPAAADHMVAERKVDRALIEDPSSFRLVYHTDGSTCDKADYYPDYYSGYFTYDFGSTMVEAGEAIVSSLTAGLGGMTTEEVEEVIRQDTEEAVEAQQQFDVLVFSGIAVGLVVVTALVTVAVTLLVRGRKQDAPVQQERRASKPAFEEPDFNY